MVKAVFFDRDGVLNELVNHDGVLTAPWSFDEFKLIPGAEQAIEIVNDLGYYTFVVTNQPDYHGGVLGLHDLLKMMRVCVDIGIDDGLFALERGSAWYKPNNGMLETLIKLHKIDRSQSYIIGDRWKDIVPGHKSKITTIFIGQEYICPDKYRHITPDYIVDNVLQACLLIEELQNDKIIR